MPSNFENLQSLGSNTTDYPTTYSPQVLEAIPFTAGAGQSIVTLHCPEFTSLCPKTAQPDFATITITYQPNDLLIESKSLKLYLFSFRNHGDFHEECIKTIANDIWNVIQPKHLEVYGDFTPRGGIKICPKVVLSAQ